MNYSARALGGLIAAIAISFAASASAQDVKHYRFAYDQPRNTGYSVAGDLFADKLKELSKGSMIIDQYPGAQLGQEPQLLQLVKSGDIDFAIISSANTATISPEAGVICSTMVPNAVPLIRASEIRTMSLTPVRASFFGIGR